MPDSGENRDAMSFRQLVAWAWRETPPVHKSGTNLLIHLIAVPLFVAGHVLLIVGAILSWWLVAIALASVLGSLILQGVGHSLEQQQDTIREANRNSGAFSAGAIRINAINRIKFLGDDAGVEIKSNEQTTSLASGAKLFECGRFAY